MSNKKSYIHKTPASESRIYCFYDQEKLCLVFKLVIYDNKQTLDHHGNRALPGPARPMAVAGEGLAWTITSLKGEDCGVNK